MTAAGFPHSEILGSRFVCQLPEAYRRLQRPSSAPSAKASTLCPYKLDHKDFTKMLASTVQFSSNDRPATPSPPATTQRRRGTRPVTTRRPPPPTRTPHKGPGQEHDPETTTNRLFPQDPTACQTHHRTRQQPFPPPDPKTEGVLGATCHNSRP